MTRCIRLCCIGSRCTIEQLGCEPARQQPFHSFSSYSVKNVSAIVAEGNGDVVKPGIVQTGFAQGNVNYL